MNTVNMTEVVFVNGLGVLLMLMLMLSRHQNKSARYYGDGLVNAMIAMTLAGCLAETASFLVDGRVFLFSRQLNYLFNSICFIGTSSVGYLWCLFVELRVYHSVLRLRRRGLILLLPLAAVWVLCLLNLGGTGLLFFVSRENIYSRGTWVVIPYLVLFFYYADSLITARRSRRNTLHLRFYPMYYFILPCIVGTVIQGLVYGISIGWTTVAVAMIFLHIQTQSMNVMVAALSGLYNRRFLDEILDRLRRRGIRTIYGVMLDVNGFKQINDNYGHAEGDQAIRHIGQLLSDALSGNSTAIRYAGDEFVLLIHTEDEEEVKTLIERIHKAAEAFSRQNRKPYPLSFSVGCVRYDCVSGDREEFLTAMDERMYEAKKAYYALTENERRRRQDDGEP